MSQSNAGNTARDDAAKRAFFAERAAEANEVADVPLFEHGCADEAAAAALCLIVAFRRLMARPDADAARIRAAFPLSADVARRTLDAVERPDGAGAPRFTATLAALVCAERMYGGENCVIREYNKNMAEVDIALSMR